MEDGLGEESTKDDIDVLVEEDEGRGDSLEASSQQEEEDSMPLREMAKSYSFRRTRKLSAKATGNWQLSGVRMPKVARHINLVGEGGNIEPKGCQKRKRERRRGCFGLEQPLRANQLVETNAKHMVTIWTCQISSHQIVYRQKNQEMF